MTLLGLVLVAAAIVALLLGADRIERIGDEVSSSGPVLGDEGMRFLDDHETALQIGGLVLGLLLIALALWWLSAQIPPTRHQHDARVVNRDADRPGRNVVEGDALARALADDLERAEPVQRARSEVRPDDQLVRLRLDVDDRVPVSDVVREHVRPAVERYVKVAELDRSPDTEIDVRLVEPERHRVS